MVWHLQSVKIWIMQLILGVLDHFTYKIKHLYKNVETKMFDELTWNFHVSYSDLSGRRRWLSGDQHAGRQLFISGGKHTGRQLFISGDQHNGRQL